MQILSIITRLSSVSSKSHAARMSPRVFGMSSRRASGGTEGCSRSCAKQASSGEKNALGGPRLSKGRPYTRVPLSVCALTAASVFEPSEGDAPAPIAACKASMSTQKGGDIDPAHKEYCYTPTFLDFGWARAQFVFKLVLANYDASVGTQAFSGIFRRTGIDCDDDIHVVVVVRYAAYGSQLDRGTVFHLIIICVRI